VGAHAGTAAAAGSEPWHLAHQKLTTRGRRTTLPTPNMRLRDWLPIDALLLYCRHTISSIGAAVSFWIMASVLRHLILDCDIRSFIDRIEHVLLIGTFLWLAVEYAADFWAKRSFWRGRSPLVLA